MEKGSLRCDANISLRAKGAAGLGVKIELKNMNSFKGIRDALAFEILRQEKVLKEGAGLGQETRGWDIESCETFLMRTKEEAEDYRYFPEPDLPPFIINVQKIEETRETIPELPRQKLERFIKEYGLSESDARILTISKKDADYAEGCITKWKNKDKKPIVNWLIGPLISESNNRKCSISDLNIPGGQTELIKLVTSVEEGGISNLTAKAVLGESLDTAKIASQIILEKSLGQISDAESLNEIAQVVIQENAKSVADYKQGKTNAIMFLVGCMMKKSCGKVNPKAAQEILKKILGNGGKAHA
jgi:aspartyl-tRNA(Asn)/glutamyl-tRNA(Gln) amidotransferase subunit B